MFKRNYSVFVGGMEVNDYYLNKQQAWSVAREWAGKGFDDVVVRKHRVRLNDTAHHILLAILFASPWLLASWLGW